MCAVALAAVLIGMPVPSAFAAAQLGACCFANGACQDLVSFQCETQDGDFIGDGTSCQAIDCAAPVAAPMLSIAGLVAALGALGGLGVYRLTIGRRRA
jgi:hypothetical protein